MMENKKANVIEHVDSKRFTVNGTGEHASTISEEVDIPIIVLDDDDDDEVKINKDYKLFLDHLKDDNTLGPLLELDRCPPLRYEADSGNSETRKVKNFNENPMKKRVSQQSKKREALRVRESIERDNRVAERRKRKLAEVEATMAVPLVRNQESIRRDSNKVRKVSESKAETLGDSLFVRTEGGVVRGKKVHEGSSDELKAETLRKVDLLVRTEEDDEQENRIDETKDVNAASEVVPAEHKAVNETSNIAHVTIRNRGDFAERRKKRKEEESVVDVDEDYMSYLTWLVESLKDYTTKPMENLHKDPYDLDSPTLDTLKENVMLPEEDLLAEVKVEQQDLESLSDDSDIIAVGDTPFLDGESTPFVSSKSVVVDLEKESKEDESSCSFRKVLMEDLKRPYSEAELSRLYREASINRRMTRCRELRKGRESDYETDTLGKSYLQQFEDFEKVYKSVDRRDKARALELLRGFFFYLKNVSHHGAFKPWINA